MVLLDLGPGPVTPPWLPLLMVIVLLVLLGFLYWSMRRNLNRIDFDEDQPTTRAGASPAAAASTSAGSTSTASTATASAATASDSPPAPLDQGSQP